MPDFIIESFYHCESAEYFSQEVVGNNGKSYIVTYGPTYGKSMYQYDYSCTCKSFKFRKNCKHIEQVKQSGKHCNWQQFLDGGEPIDKDGKKLCPKCGAAVRVERHAI